uniref:Transmembrane protein 200A n=1 Tax=Neogobius melanostomus TaxID=47308 RepID=A0A8C6TSB2_9GOBI
MTAAAGVLTGLAKLKRQDSCRSQHRPISALEAKRKRRTDVVIVRGRLRLYSASGFFLLLGLVILAVGICMATLGYWPHSDRRDAAKQSVGLLTRFLEQHRHSERMKMFGPFTMGIGIFIFICANAILHENRDRETKIIHMRDMYSTVIDIHRLRQKEQKQQLHRNSTFAREAFSDNISMARNSLLGFASRSAGGSAEEEEGLLGEEEQVKLDCSFAGLLAPLYRDRPFYNTGLGLSHADSVRHQWSVDGDGARGGHHARSIVTSSISAFTLPVIKLNNCVIDEPEMEAITEEDRGAERRDDRSQTLTSMESLTVPAATVAKASKPPGLHRSNSAASSSHCSSASTLSPASSTSGCWLSPGAARSDFGSNSSLHMLSSHSKSLDLERRSSLLSVHHEQRKHPSWPRLDRSSSKGYTRLEDREDHVGERLLDDSAAAAAARRDYSKREKLLMISRSHNNLSFEHDEFNNSTLKRGSSETRF